MPNKNNGTASPVLIDLVERMERQEMYTEGFLRTIEATTKELKESATAQREAFEKLTKPSWWKRVLGSIGVLAVVGYIVWQARQPTPEQLDMVNKRIDTVQESVHSIDKTQSNQAKDIKTITDTLIDINKRLP